MSARVDPSLVWLRALVVGALTFAVGVVGHVSADGLLPTLPALAIVFALCVAASAPLLLQQAASARLVAMLMGGQFGVHLMLTMTAGHRGDHAVSTTPSAPARPIFGEPTLPVVDGRRIGSLSDAYRAANEPSQLAPEQATALPFQHLISDLVAHAPMMVAHLAAAAVVGWWLACGEKTLWALLALLGRWILATIRVWAYVAVPPMSGSTRPPAALAAIALPHWQTRPHPRRGPPFVIAA